MAIIIIVVKIIEMTKQANKLFGCCPACVAYLEYAQPCVGQIQPNGVSLQVVVVVIVVVIAPFTSTFSTTTVSTIVVVVVIVVLIGCCKAGNN